MPLARPALVTLTVLVFMWTWNEFLIPLVMVDLRVRCAPPRSASRFFQGQYTQGFTLLAAGALHRGDAGGRWSTSSSSATSSRGMLEGAVRE